MKSPRISIASLLPYNGERIHQRTCKTSPYCSLSTTWSEKRLGERITRNNVHSLIVNNFIFGHGTMCKASPVMDVSVLVQTNQPTNGATFCFQEKIAAILRRTASVVPHSTQSAGFFVIGSSRSSRRSDDRVALFGKPGNRASHASLTTLVTATFGWN